MGVACGISLRVVLVGCCFLLLFCAFLASQVFITYRHPESGVVSLIALYAGMVVSTLVGPFVVKRVGSMRSLALLGFPGYVAFAAAVALASGWLVTAGGVLCGLSAGVLWVALPAVIRESSPKASLGVNNAAFYFLLRSSLLFNGAIGSAVDGGMSLDTAFVGVALMGLLAWAAIIVCWIGFAVADRKAQKRLVAPSPEQAGASSSLEMGQLGADTAGERHPATGGNVAPAKAPTSVAREVGDSIARMWYLLTHLRHVKHMSYCVVVLALARGFSYSTLPLQAKALLGEAAIGHTSMVVGITILFVNVATGPLYDCVYRRGLPETEAKGASLLLISFVAALGASGASIVQYYGGQGYGWLSYAAAVMVGVLQGTNEGCTMAVIGHMIPDKSDLKGVLALRTISDGVGVIIYMLAHALLPEVGAHVTLVVFALVALVVVWTWPAVVDGEVVHRPRRPGRVSAESLSASGAKYKADSVSTPPAAADVVSPGGGGAGGSVSSAEAGAAVGGAVLATTASADACS